MCPETLDHLGVEESGRVVFGHMEDAYSPLNFLATEVVIFHYRHF